MVAKLQAGGCQLFLMVALRLPPVNPVCSHDAYMELPTENTMWTIALLKWYFSVKLFDPVMGPLVSSSTSNPTSACRAWYGYKM